MVSEGYSVPGKWGVMAVDDKVWQSPLTVHRDRKWTQGLKSETQAITSKGPTLWRLHLLNSATRCGPRVQNMSLWEMFHIQSSESVRGLQFVSATQQTTPLLDSGKTKTPILAVCHLNKSRLIISKHEDICYTAVTLVRIDSSWLTGEPCFSTQERRHLRLVIHPSGLWRWQCTSCTGCVHKRPFVGLFFSATIFQLASRASSDVKRIIWEETFQNSFAMFMPFVFLSINFNGHFF